MQRFVKSKMTRAALGAAVLVGTLVSSGGALSSPAGVSSAAGTGLSFPSFAGTFVEQVVQQQVSQAMSSSHNGSGSAGSSAPSTSSASTGSSSSGSNGTDVASFVPHAQSVAPQVQSAASTQDVIDALLALLTSAQPKALAAIDTAEAAVIAKLEDAKTQINGAFTQVGQVQLPQTGQLSQLNDPMVQQVLAQLGLSDIVGQATGQIPQLTSGLGLGPIQQVAIAAIDNAEVLVRQAFAQVRAQVVAAFAQAANEIVTQLTGVDLGEGTQIVLDKIAEIQTQIDAALAHVQDILDSLNINLP
jgi:hypothetical protein